MKKAIVASVLGVIASVATTYGQGQIVFDNYNAASYNPIRYINDVSRVPEAALAGTIVQGADANGLVAQLYWGIGDTFTSLGELTPVTTAPVAIGTQVAGYAVGPGVTIPGYVSGPVTFAVVAYATQGAYAGDGTYAGSLLSGASALFVEPSISAVPNPAGNFTVGVPQITVAIVPEPTTLALAGLGAVSLLAFMRRRKA